jgi:hypothetical protein
MDVFGHVIRGIFYGFEKASKKSVPLIKALEFRVRDVTAP